MNRESEQRHIQARYRAAKQGYNEGLHTAQWVIRYMLPIGTVPAGLLTSILKEIDLQKINGDDHENKYR